MNILLIILTCVLVAIFGWAALNPSWIYRFTTLFAAAFAGFALPQLIGLSNETSVLATNVLPEGSLDIVILVSILCLFAVILGDIRGVNHPGRKPIVGYDQYDGIRLIRVAVGLTVSGFIIFQIGYAMLDKSYLDNLSTQTSGPITLLYFFQMMQRYGLALSVLCYFRYRSPVALMSVIAVVASQFVSSLFTARRGTTADLVFILILGTYFGRRLVLPAWLLGLVFVVGTITSNSIGSFRGKSDLSFLERFERAEILTQFGWTLENGGHELVNAAVISWCVEWEGDYDYGTYYWTQLVHAYFPGQIFGYDLKRMLMLPSRDHALEVRGFRGPPGATCTGMCDAFRSFWYFGCIKFFVIAYVMGRWWYRANKGDLWSQLAYTALMVSALHTVSHGTHWILNSYLHMFIFSYFPMYWCRVHKSTPLTSMGVAPVRLAPSV